MRDLVVIIFTVAAVVVLSPNSCRGQLNFEGNPLTDNTEYAAEESHYSSARQEDKRQSKNIIQSPVDPYLVAVNSINRHANEFRVHHQSPTAIINSQSKEANGSVNAASSTPIYRALSNTVPATADTFNKDSISRAQLVPAGEFVAYQSDSTRQAVTPMRDAALELFLNSQTPEESQYALDNYLRSREQADRSVPTALTSNQNVYEPTLPQNNNPVDSFPDYPPRSAMISPIEAATPHWYPPGHFWPPVALQNRRDTLAGPRRRHGYWYRAPSPRFRGRPHSQSRIGHGYVARGPPVNALAYGGPSKPPVEVIYTKPPGFGPSSGPISNSPVPYEDASAHFPESDHPPPTSKDVYYSQLYAQSYDPHYYNYIADTGKVKPWLYGKLGPHKHSSGFWGELYHSFKKHGMKNMMNPMFLLGLSIPALTLLLSAMVQKRSFARSNAGLVGNFMSEEKMNELTAKVREAIECYEKNNVRNEDCWK